MLVDAVATWYLRALAQKSAFRAIVTSPRNFKVMQGIVRHALALDSRFLGTIRRWVCKLRDWIKVPPMATISSGSLSKTGSSYASSSSDKGAKGMHMRKAASSSSASSLRAEPPPDMVSTDPKGYAQFCVESSAPVFVLVRKKCMSEKGASKGGAGGVVISDEELVCMETLVMYNEVGKLMGRIEASEREDEVDRSTTSTWKAFMMTLLDASMELLNVVHVEHVEAASKLCDFTVGVTFRLWAQSGIADVDVWKKLYARISDDGFKYAQRIVGKWLNATARVTLAMLTTIYVEQMGKGFGKQSAARVLGEKRTSFRRGAGAAAATSTTAGSKHSILRRQIAGAWLMTRQSERRLIQREQERRKSWMRISGNMPRDQSSMCTMIETGKGVSVSRMRSNGAVTVELLVAVDDYSFLSGPEWNSERFYALWERMLDVAGGGHLTRLHFIIHDSHAHGSIVRALGSIMDLFLQFRCRGPPREFGLAEYPDLPEGIVLEADDVTVLRNNVSFPSLISIMDIFAPAFFDVCDASAERYQEGRAQAFRELFHIMSMHVQGSGESSGNFILREHRARFSLLVGEALTSFELYFDYRTSQSFSGLSFDRAAAPPAKAAKGVCSPGKHSSLLKSMMMKKRTSTGMSSGAVPRGDDVTTRQVIVAIFEGTASWCARTRPPYAMIPLLNAIRRIFTAGAKPARDFYSAAIKVFISLREFPSTTARFNSRR